MPSFVPMSDEDREISIETFSGYLHGKCFFFALAVARGTGAQLVVIEQSGTIVHAGVRSQKGFRDLRGDMSVEAFVSSYVCGNEFIIRNTTEEELLRVSEEVNGEPVTEEMLADARRHAESAWPEWGWQESHLSNVLAFTGELEALCSKYGVYIREMYPGSPPVICGMEGDESFQVESFPNPTNQFLLRRRIK